ncbi:hypothetical protein ACQ4M3_35310 [Leptolyngbya sp. AN03gr2]|uniref:hypothetical protein n=1 Tax=unclassified Leptolyngbya TaxID=2650499 RepID=UPI003D319F6E
MLVVEAKRDDLDYGVTQLIAEMIEVDQWDSAPSVENQPILVGSVTTGIFWQFVTLDRTNRQITQELNTFRVPDELDTIVTLLIHALGGKNAT